MHNVGRRGRGNRNSFAIVAYTTKKNSLHYDEFCTNNIFFIGCIAEILVIALLFHIRTADFLILCGGKIFFISGIYVLYISDSNAF